MVSVVVDDAKENSCGASLCSDDVHGDDPETYQRVTLMSKASSLQLTKLTMHNHITIPGRPS